MRLAEVDLEGVRARSELARDPSSPWQVNIVWSDTAKLHEVSSARFTSLFLFAQQQAQRLECFLQARHPELAVGRNGLMYDGIEPRIALIPMVGTERDEWTPVLAAEDRFDAKDPGFVDTRSGAKKDTAELRRWRDQLRPPPHSDDFTFLGAPDDESLFAKIVKGTAEQQRVYQDASSVGVLTPFPNSPYLTVLVPRHHASSDILSLAEREYRDLIQSTFHAIKIFDAVKAVGVAIVMEGFEIDYAHVKLTPRFDHTPDRSTIFMEQYEGYLTSLKGPERAVEQMQAEEQELRSFLLDDAVQ